ncbi:hypothetical protein L1049_004391 [Liquidambar formosana]|uniref:B box-type domain-containing protein n=1 Tax=Liquidambar formosana TaxID=63359 RepID=A0AAP0X073_LIQFO
MKARVCELCTGEAALFCASDSAFLCWDCDARVHEANFLVARHVRQTVCSKCKGFDGNRISGVGFGPSRPVCRSCFPESPDDRLDSLSSSSASACVSSTESFAAATKKIDFDRRKMERIVSSSCVTENSGDDSNFPARFSGEVTSTMMEKSRAEPKTKTQRSRAPSKVDAKAEGIFVNWCRKLGLSYNYTVRVASQALSVCLAELTVLPFRVSVAASFWFSLRLRRESATSTCQNLKRLEEISGVPAKLILATESKLARVLRVRKELRDQEEGWAECSV